MQFKSCIDCPHHEEQADPDPLDWFCDDDLKVVCTLAKKNVTVGCRPYQTRKETSPPPNWCPLRKQAMPDIYKSMPETYKWCLGGLCLGLVIGAVFVIWETLVCTGELTQWVPK